MFTMFRMRRYRVFLICAAIITFALVRTWGNGQWNDASSVFGLDDLKASKPQTPPPPSTPAAKQEELALPDPPATKDSSDTKAPSKPLNKVEDLFESPKSELAGDSVVKEVSVSSSSAEQTSTPTPKPTPTANDEPTLTPTSEVQPGGLVADSTSHEPQLAEQTPPPAQAVDKFELDSYASSSSSTTSSVIHWTKLPEHFPVPTESLIHLPTGAPAIIPKIQHEFDAETADQKSRREKRLTSVKDEFQKAWNGYKDHAWLHDELSPKSGNFRDPFCGWAATLVDTLDTLWIMGLEAEFAEAAAAVDLIDFTTSPRNDIPVFETTIRYLGGLVAAYDVSGAKFPNLLDKAVELAEILLGAFDTPNRMPLLFYQWKPDFVSQPHRASSSANLAELGSLSMEFTRLAQITKDQRYYDAVARITDALADWQQRGTKLDGVFPDSVDASGCNRTATYLSNVPRTARESENASFGEIESSQLIEADESVGSGNMSISLGSALDVEESDTAQDIIENLSLPAAKTISRRQLEDSTLSEKDAVAAAEVPSLGEHRKSKSASKYVGIKSQTPMEMLECVEQGLESSSPNGRNTFSMGGGQDSTYEYFTKQYLLLGGLEEKYKTMYLRTMPAIRDYMIFRPMIPDPTTADILVSGQVTASGDPSMPVSEDVELNPELTHLTCFLGGMVGMGARVFNLPDDMDTAARLTDGCVWAYATTPTGVMPELATLVPCPSKPDAETAASEPGGGGKKGGERYETCRWNETLWYESLDPYGPHRAGGIEKYFERKAQEVAEKAAAQEALRADEERLQLAADDAKRRKAAEAKAKADEYGFADAARAEVDVDANVDAAVGAEVDGEVDATDGGAEDAIVADGADGDEVIMPAKRDEGGRGGKGEDLQPATHKKRQIDDATLAAENADPLAAAAVAVKADAAVDNNTTTTNTDGDVKRQTLSKDSADLAGAQTAVISPSKGSSLLGDDNDEGVVEEPTKTKAFVMPSAEEMKNDKNRPQTHEEFVQSRLKREKLPKGYSRIGSKKYILRPEAIESVWYMYRITGSPAWQEKGWEMFTSVIEATSTTYGHSAIVNVFMSPEGDDDDDDDDEDSSSSSSSSSSLRAKKKKKKEKQRDAQILDEMESFWLAETLKYFYLLFAEPDVVSLDEWVLNTEAHPFKRPS